MSYNKVILMGNLTRDPDYKVTPNGHQICKLGIAVNRRFTTQAGEQREEVTFVDVDAWGRQAETISKYFTKGKPILVEGRLRMDEWENPQGERRSKLLVQLETFSFVSDGGGTQTSGDRTPSQSQLKTTAPKPSPPPSGSDNDAGDVPF